MLIFPGEIAVINFPTRLGPWKCLVSELEIVRRGPCNANQLPGLDMIGEDVAQQLREQQRQLSQQ